ncbi:LAMI_0D03620g1_1 [Lachancea mirantina]|uniref:LAMI_0D03620g1_1 n=1 Tax=Lachancea mirantina TaxID=1230905 RepID=A0A1G4JA49_9SACH|nr:LAMI_0D03620g1_1 [Lachancea mirantina]
MSFNRYNSYRLRSRTVHKASRRRVPAMGQGAVIRAKQRAVSLCTDVLELSILVEPASDDWHWVLEINRLPQVGEEWKEGQAVMFQRTMLASQLISRNVWGSTRATRAPYAELVTRALRLPRLVAGYSSGRIQPRLMSVSKQTLGRSYFTASKMSCGKCEKAKQHLHAKGYVHEEGRGESYDYNGVVL